MSLRFDKIRVVQSPLILHAWITTGVQEWTRLHDGQRGSRATTVGWRAWFAKQFPSDVKSMRALYDWIVESAGLLPAKGQVVLPSENHMVDIAITLVQHERKLGPAGLVTREGVLRGVQTQIRNQCLQRNPIMEAVDAMEGEVEDEAYWTIRLKEHRERSDISHVARRPAPGRPARPVDPDLVQLFSQWANALRVLCGPRSQDELAAMPNAETDAVADIVEEMRAVKPSFYNTAKFFDALAATGLPVLIGDLTRPAAFFTHQHHQVVQQRLLCISDHLSVLLVQWTPKAVAEGWAILDTNYRSPDENAHAYPKLTPASFIKILRRFEDLLPRGETPTCVFMFYAYLPFRDGWNRWIAAAIDTIPEIPVRPSRTTQTR
ncbi:hypothetical protein K523DRAFT_159857 [Schizophyllum commune Tattone D]|nr:hypothetical protein K523DRAFT_159857 [Schizophyllum commune Tattone D]